MDIYIKKYSKNSLAISILLIILSLFLIFNPIKSLELIVRLIGIIVAINGVIHTISYFTNSSEFKAYSLELIEGIICITLGILFIINPSIVNNFLNFIIGTWIILESIIKLQIAFNIRNIVNSNWGKLLIISVITFIIGIVILFNPFSGIATITTICGVTLLISEILNIIEAVYMLKI